MPQPPRSASLTMSDMFALSPSPSPLSPAASAVSSSSHSGLSHSHPHQTRTLSTDLGQQLESTVSHEKSGKKKDVYKMLFENHLHSPLASVTINPALQQNTASTLSHSEHHDHHSASRSATASLSPQLNPIQNNNTNNATANALPRSRLHSITSNSTSDQFSPLPRRSTSPTPSSSVTSSTATAHERPQPVPLNEVEEDSKRYLDFAKQLAERTKDPLDSQDIWKLCTRAKHAIDGGERLENLSWRLFEMSLSKERKARRDGGENLFHPFRLFSFILDGYRGSVSAEIKDRMLDAVSCQM
ncbi:hypothetical protein BDR26DRAFT_894712 [Obelidium mucronatum]|nr:hypothetical protein BDR26DRAFT_894712 [Obelidium mucronatum]